MKLAVAFDKERTGYPGGGDLPPLSLSFTKMALAKEASSGGDRRESKEAGGEGPKSPTLESTAGPPLDGGAMSTAAAAAVAATGMVGVTGKGAANAVGGNSKVAKAPKLNVSKVVEERIAADTVAAAPAAAPAAAAVGKEPAASHRGGNSTLRSGSGTLRGGGSKKQGGDKGGTSHRSHSSDKGGASQRSHRSATSTSSGGSTNRKSPVKKAKGGGAVPPILENMYAHPSLFTSLGMPSPSHRPWCHVAGTRRGRS